jgi:hypothetical protein
MTHPTAPNPSPPNEIGQNGESAEPPSTAADAAHEKTLDTSTAPSASIRRL